MISNIQTQFQIERDIPFGCKTITIDKQRIFLIGGELNNQAQKLTWQFNNIDMSLDTKKEMN